MHRIAFRRDRQNSGTLIADENVRKRTCLRTERRLFVIQSKNELRYLYLSLLDILTWDFNWVNCNKIASCLLTSFHESALNFLYSSLLLLTFFSLSVKISRAKYAKRTISPHGIVPTKLVLRDNLALYTHSSHYPPFLYFFPPFFFFRLSFFFFSFFFFFFWFFFQVTCLPSHTIECAVWAGPFSRPPRSPPPPNT